MIISTKYFLLFLLIFILFPSYASAKDLTPNYVSVGIAFPTPTNYTDFDFGIGGYVNMGWLTHFGLFEVDYFDTVRPARSDQAHNIELERIQGSGPSDYSSRAMTIGWGLYSNLNNMFLKAKVGISYREYQIKRPDDKISETAFGLSYGAGVGWSIFDKGFFMLEYNSIDHLIGTGNLGLLILF